MAKKVTQLIPWLLMATFALLPFSAKIANVTALLVLVLWLLEGGLKEKWARIRSNPVAWLPIFYFLILCMGLLWTSDIGWGLHIIKKSRRFLLIPVFISVATAFPKVWFRGSLAFVVSSALSALVSLGVASHWLPVFGHATRKSPSPFVYHTSYGPALAWAAYLALALALFSPKISKGWKTGLGVSAGIITLALFVNIGVAGYAAFLMLCGLLVWQWRKNILWPMLAGLLLVGSAYFLSPTVHRRVNQNINEVLSYKEKVAHQESPEAGTSKSSSIGPRLVFWENTWQIIKQYPVLGAGTGDFPVEYEKVRQRRTPNHWQDVDNPHNMYLMIWAQSGLLGLGIVLAFFGFLLRQALQRPGGVSSISVGLICFMMFIMISDAYLTLAHISLMFALFVAGVGQSGLVEESADV